MMILKKGIFNHWRRTRIAVWQRKAGKCPAFIIMRFSISAVSKIYQSSCDRFLIIFVIWRADARITNHFIIFSFPIYYGKLEIKMFLNSPFLSSSPGNDSFLGEEQVDAHRGTLRWF